MKGFEMRSEEFYRVSTEPIVKKLYIIKDLSVPTEKSALAQIIKLLKQGEIGLQLLY